MPDESKSPWPGRMQRYINSPGPIGPGELVYDIAPWKIYRQDAGMGEKEYRVFLNNVFFCQTENQITAEEIIKAMIKSTKARWMDQALNEGDGVYRP